MVNCSICYEKFITKDELKNYYDTHKDNLDIEKFFDLKDLVLNDKTYMCPTENCSTFICDKCHRKLIDICEIENDEPFKCPYCRQTDWKLYFDGVLGNLLIKTIGIEKFTEKIMNE